MITFLSSPKPFKGLALRNQIRAIRSWQGIAENAEVILYGNVEGIESASRESGIKYVPDITTNEYGTPLFNAIVKHAAQNAKHNIQIYLNCDIILTSMVLEAINCVKFSSFLMTGQRINLMEDSDIVDIPDKNYILNFLKKQYAADKIKLQSLHSADYFIFQRGLLDDVSPIAIGRWCYENVLIQFCLERRIPVIDATLMIPAVHQYHEYEFIKGGREEAEFGVEARRNKSFLKCPYAPSLIDVPWQLRDGKLRRVFGRGDWLQALETYFRLIRKDKILAKFVKYFRLFTGYFGISKVRETSLSDVLNAYSNEVKY